LEASVFLDLSNPELLKDLFFAFVLSLNQEFSVEKVGEGSPDGKEQKHVPSVLVGQSIDNDWKNKHYQSG
jgi:hypothetical protein